MNSKEIKHIAITKAKQSFCRYKISAIGLDKHGTILGTSTNRPRIDRKFGGLHAEIVLIRRYKEIIIFDNDKGKVILKEVFL